MPGRYIIQVLAVHLDNFLFLLLLAAAGLFQFLSKAISKKTEDQTPPTTPPTPPRTRPIPRAAPQSDQERVRKLLEALGQPTASQRPPPVAPRPTYRKPRVLPRIPPLASPLPPLVTRPPDLPAEIAVPSQTAPVAVQRPDHYVIPSEPTFETHQPPVPPEPIGTIAGTADELRTGAPSDLVQRVREVTTLLRSPSGLRDAIIVREILGQPRGLREFELP